MKNILYYIYSASEDSITLRAAFIILFFPHAIIKWSGFWECCDGDGAGYNTGDVQTQTRENCADFFLQKLISSSVSRAINIRTRFVLIHFFL